MSRLATRRLIDAAASLEAADRALLNIWTSRGLDDAELARMTGMTEATIAGRRERIVAQLSGVLELPPEDVRAALTEIVADHEEGPADETAATGPAATSQTEVANGSPPVSETPTERLESNGRPARPAEDRPSGRRRRWPWAALALVVLIGVIVVIASAGSSGSEHRRPHAPGVHTVATASSSAAAPSPTPSPAGSTSLTTLPGSPTQAIGAIAMVGHGSSLRLNLTVRNLPPASKGHYEVWLYDSLVSSEPLGRLRTGVTRLSLRVPADARRYPWIDISFQPLGEVFHSGESKMRAANPLFGKPAG